MRQSGKSLSDDQSPDMALLSAGFRQRFAKLMSVDTSQNTLSILLVEDHADTAQAIESLLSMMGHSVRMADSVETAVREIVNARFDLIISDVGLPDGNGISLMHCIRPFCGTFAIAVTAHGRDEDIARCKSAGFNVHLTKPVGFEVLKKVVDDFQSSSARAQRPPLPA